MKLERRMVSLDRIEIRGGKGSTRILDGHAAVYNKDSEEMFGFTERVAPGAFDTALKEKDDVRALFNHDPNYVLGRSTAKTLRMKDDGSGLGFEVDLPDTTFARDLVVSIERCDITGCSFAFRTRKDQWVHDKTSDRVMRTLLDVELFDVGPVTYPAYPDTDVAARSLMQEIATAGRKLAGTDVVVPVSGLAVRQLRRRLDLIAAQ